jgi:type IV pilus assembly protein PilB
MSIKLGDVLVTAGAITTEQLNHAISVQQQEAFRRRLGQVLQDLGYVKEKEMLLALSVRVGCPFIDMSQKEVDPEAISLVPRKVAEEHLLIPLSYTEDKIEIAINDPLNFRGIQEVREQTGLYPIISIAEKEKIEEAIDVYYADYSAKEFVMEANRSVSKLVPEIQEEIDETENEAMVVKLINGLLIRGYTINCSDIHIEPYENRTRIRMRIDGILVDYTYLEAALHPNVVARIKIMSRLDIAEKRIPQDGHFKATLEDIVINARVSTTPTVFGEKVVIRYLNSNTEITNQQSFGMQEHHYLMVEEMMKSPHGIVYVTGPTGSGKTTTLYMMMERLLERSVNISTIEDPVERTIYGLNQIQINPPAGLTFASGLRSLLRQDPDIIMVGETRDSETASISVRAAITGHLVLSTLHTNDAVSSIVRLEDMGVERYLLSSALVGIIAQRLVRKICPECVEVYVATEAEKLMMETRGIGITYRGVGCKTCNHTGYLGRMGIHEIVMVDTGVKKMMLENQSMEDITEYLRQTQGFQSLEASVRDLVNQGETTFEEYLRVQYSVL